MDIHNVEFKRSFRGYDPEEVDDYLASIVGKYESVYRDNQILQEELAQVKKELQQKGQKEQDVLDLISLTKQTAAEIKKLSNREAENLVAAADSEAEKILSAARLEAQRIVADAESRLARLQRAESQLKEKVRLTMESIWNILNEEDVDLVSTRPYRKAAASRENPEAAEDNED